MDIHHVGQLLDADFERAVAFYESLGLDLRATTEGPVRVAFFGTGSAEFHLVVREARGSPADDLLDTVGRYSAAHVAFEVDDLSTAMADAEALGLSFVGDPPEDGLGPYRRAFVAPEGHIGIPFEFVEPR
ncbi:VOC family protein [Halosegnis marinus]|uniref:VOC family protein n=1 Tax=Halosegnis marinus TaxID=3034023 RepID=A0ABD5ZJV4_9EURY|nr:VOC family protein [Halosegnis sp. DT85]